MDILFKESFYLSKWSQAKGKCGKTKEPTQIIVTQDVQIYLVLDSLLYAIAQRAPIKPVKITILDLSSFLLSCIH